MRLDVGPVLRTLARQPAVFTTLVLEVAAGVASLTALLLAASWYGVIGAKPTSFDEQNLALVSSYTPGADEDAVAAEQRADLARVRATPGVEAATSVDTSVLDDRWTYPALFRAPGSRRHQIGWPVHTDDEAPRALRLAPIAGVMPEPRVGAGRSDDSGPVRSAVVSICVAKALFGSAPAAIGQTIVSDQTAPVRVSAVVANVTMRVPFMPNAGCVAFLFGGAPRDHEARILARAAPGQRDALVARLADVFAGAAPRRWVDVRALDSDDSQHHRVGHGLATFLSLFGALVGVIAQLGALAATSFLVAQRRRQIGIRRALGATKADIVTYFLVENAFTMFAGSIVGLVGTAGLYVVMRSYFNGLAVDVAAIVLGLVLFWIAALAATLVPALRAARVPPGVASRSP
ncbi:MAG TPA: FtsX-like permease family protein [Polyangia bacterium]|nr:FtsX-like permease family protein [Polyangia bacterium]